jgi:hypothetical protein
MWYCDENLATKTGSELLHTCNSLLFWKRDLTLQTKDKRLVCSNKYIQISDLIRTCAGRKTNAKKKRNARKIAREN